MKLLFLLFVILLFLSNAFLFKEGLWLYQDQSFWYKNSLEAFAFLNTQFHSFTNFSYYLGYDQGILSANNIFSYSIFLVLYQLFGSSGSQIALMLLSYILAFFSFWAFSSLFFKDKKTQMILSLLYVFNPLLYSFRGQGLIYSAPPLFIYSFYMFYVSKKYSERYLLLNILSCFLWISNVRFLEAYLFIVVLYLAYLFFSSKHQFLVKKLIVYVLIAIGIFLPIIYSFLTPLFQHSPSIFNYGTVLSSYVPTSSFYEAFNPFQSFNVILYDNRLYAIGGICFFIVFLALLIKNVNKDTSKFFIVNIALLLLGITFFELSTVSGEWLYTIIIKLVPFLTNAPFYGLYIVGIPFIFLLGLISEQQKKTFATLAFLFIFLGIIPLLNLSYFPLQKYNLSKLPTQYQNYFVTPFYGIPESTAYFPTDCWRAEYMERANVPTQCLNRGIHYPTIAFDNPRAISGQEYYLIKKSYLNQNIDNLRITHNVKDVIVAKDIVPERDAGPQYSSEDIVKTKEIDTYYKKDRLLHLDSDTSFDAFSFKNKNDYDFFLYSPQKIVVKNSIDSIFDNSLQLSPRPVVLTQQESKNISNNLQQNVAISYKQSQFDPTQVYLKLSHVTNDKPFFLQFTQAYKSGWKFVWINKDEYQNKQCFDKQTFYSITNNSRCQFRSSLIDPSLSNLLNKQSVDSNNHILGNYVANSWFIEPNTIPNYAKNGNDVYAVIVYVDQIYYGITLLIAGCVLLLVIIYILMQEVKIICQRYL